ncbi:MAG TPA: hypothetical protein VG034_00305 [Acidimicrobiia bacterium]|nr:hypothetical protein [Acidimicrobiia bacterium]
MFRRGFFVVLAASASLLTIVAVPAQAGADLVQKKSAAGPNGRSGSVERYSDVSGSKVSNYVRLTADDNDGPGGKCTETWVDYSTKPHEHWNPGVFVNCAGGKRSVSPAMTNNGKTIRGIGIVVCEVPNTSGRIVRNSGNCRGQLGAMYLHSGQPYSRFAVTADQHPDGIQVYKA